MTRKGRGQNSPPRAGLSWPIVLAALAVFGLLGSVPEILAALHLRPVAATSSYGVKLLQAPPQAGPVRLPAVARPVRPNQPTASLPHVDLAAEASIVTAEDNRIRLLLHDAVHILVPKAVATRGALPTLVLPARSRPYTAADLATYGALTMQTYATGELGENVFVPAGARLSLGAPLRTLLMNDTSSGFTSIVAWDGSLSFAGTASQPLTIEGWDPVNHAPAADHGEGRPYIRELAGTMTLSNIRASALGFWSGRTGGVAWTGVSSHPSHGRAQDSRFTGDTYGAFVSRGTGVRFADDAFQSNQLDGLHIHRYSVGSTVTASSAARNGGSGFVVERATRKTTLQGDVSEHNGNNGYFVDGRPLVTSASASGGSVAPSSKTVITSSSALNNARTGILVEGGTGTVIKADQVCARITAIAVRYDATNSVLTGNDVRCGPRSGLSIGPSAPGTVVSGNFITHPRTGILLSSPGAVTLDDNRITGATVFGIAAHGPVSQLKGIGNVLSGTGIRPIDAAGYGNVLPLMGTNSASWAHHVKLTFMLYLRFHPLAALWLGMLILVLAAAVWSRRRRPRSHPYPASTHWRGDLTQSAAATSTGLDTPSAARAAPTEPAWPVTEREPVTRNGLAAQYRDRAPHRDPRWEPARQQAPAPHRDPRWEPARHQAPAPHRDPRWEPARHQAPARPLSSRPMRPPWTTAPQPAVLDRPPVRDDDDTGPVPRPAGWT